MIYVAKVLVVRTAKAEQGCGDMPSKNPEDIIKATPWQRSRRG